MSDGKFLFFLLFIILNFLIEIQVFGARERNVARIKIETMTMCKVRGDSKFY